LNLNTKTITPKNDQKEKEKKRENKRYISPSPITRTELFNGKNDRERFLSPVGRTGLFNQNNPIDSKKKLKNKVRKGQKLTMMIYH
jgi:hypothetical protein